MKVISSGDKTDIRKIPTGYTGKKLNKQTGKELLEKKIERLSELQDMLYADGRYSLLIVLQALDAAGKDSTINKVFSGVNPQGCSVKSFKKPTDEELRHDFLWRCVEHLPEKGDIGIFNRSYYEEVITVKVHPEFLEAQKLPPDSLKNIWESRYKDINHFEEYLQHNGTIVLKFYLNVSKKEQAKRFLDRATLAEKNWKIGAYDMKERERWDDYMHVINDMIRNTSTHNSPWHLVPADDKWYTHLCVINTIIEKLESLDLKYPKPTAGQVTAIKEVKEKLGTRK